MTRKSLLMTSASAHAMILSAQLWPSDTDRAALAVGLDPARITTSGPERA